MQSLLPDTFAISSDITLFSVSSWVWSELKAVRNIKPAFHKYGLYGGMAYTGLFYVLGKDLTNKLS